MIPSIPCVIAQPNENLLTMQDGSDGAHLIIVTPTGNPGEQEWIVEHRSENTVVIRNLKHDKYVGLQGEVQTMAPVVASNTPVEFTLEGAYGRNCHMLYVEAGGERLYLDISMMRMFPPQSALLPFNLAGNPWTFQPSE